MPKPAHLTSSTSLCPCGSQQVLSACCGSLLSGTTGAETPEQLMRSRYSAYALADYDYLQRTQHPDYRDPQHQRVADIAWKRLEILHTHTKQDTGEVEFKAWYEQSGRLQLLHERSRFVRYLGQWFYTDGDLKSTQQQPMRGQNKIGRNDPCPCGSGKKHKKCCG